MKEVRSGHTTIILVQGDITAEKSDAIVNAANSHLAHGGGVAAAIARKAGEELIIASRQAPHVPTGQVYTTPAGNLHATYVIHAVGPVWHGGTSQEAKLLAAAIRNSLQEADRLQCTSISLPAISTGIYGYPLDQAASVIISTILEYVANNKQTQLAVIRLVLYTSHDLAVFEKTLDQVQRE